jgi:hypothetical protein
MQLRKPAPNALRVEKVSSTVTLGACEVCNAQFRCYLPNPEQANWELRAWFDKHRCDSWGKRPKSA